MAERIEFYMDEHVPRAVTAGLRLRGLEVLTAQEAGLQGAHDEEHLTFASRGSWVIFTQDVDFLRLHAAGRPHRGIVYAPQQTAIGAIVRGLMLLCDLFSAEDMIGHDATAASPSDDPRNRGAPRHLQFPRQALRPGPAFRESVAGPTSVALDS